MLQFDFFVIDPVLIEAATDLYVPAKKEGFRKLILFVRCKAKKCLKEVRTSSVPKIFK